MTTKQRHNQHAYHRRQKTSYRGRQTVAPKPCYRRGVRKRALHALIAVAVVAVVVLPLLNPQSTIAEEPATTQRSTLANLMSQAQFAVLESKYKATLAPEQHVDPAAYAAAVDSSALSPIDAPMLFGITQDANGAIISWKKSAGAQGYAVYKSLDGQIWEQAASLKKNARCYHDTAVEAGAAYCYAVVATTSADGYRNSSSSSITRYVFLQSPDVKVSKRKTHATISWQSALQATSYTVQYAANRFFIGAKTVEVDDGSTTSVTVSGLGKDAKCYARIKALRAAGGDAGGSNTGDAADEGGSGGNGSDSGSSSSNSGSTASSSANGAAGPVATTASKAPWSYSNNATGDVDAALSQVKVTKKVKVKSTKSAKKASSKKKAKYKKKRVVFELRRAAGQKLEHYDTLQGSCQAGGYGYYALNDRNLNKGKIVKVKLSTMKVVKVSKALDIYHANDITANTKEGYLVVNHSSGDPLGLSVIDMNSLKIKRDVTIPKRVSGLFNAAEAKDGAGITKIRGVSSIAYNVQRDCYVASVWSTHDIVELDASFKPTRVIALADKSIGSYQNIAVGNDVIIVSTCPNDEQSSNILWCYDWDGQLLSKVYLPNSTELESVFFEGSCLHANFYVSGQQTKTKTVTETQYVTNAAGKTVAKKVKRKVEYTAVTRDNYCFKVKGI